jgi:hypothetical protein
MNSSDQLKIYLGPATRLRDLFSYPNGPDINWSLGETIQHWFKATLIRDGFPNVSITIHEEPEDFVMVLSTPDDKLSQLRPYCYLLPQFLANGWQAYETVTEVKATGLWNFGPPVEDKWRFFIDLGLPMITQRSLQFLHYPPKRLLDVFQDHMHDEVDDRWIELLAAQDDAHWDKLVTQVSRDKKRHRPKEPTPLGYTIINATPIAAPDSAGAGPPTSAFGIYQEKQLQLLVKESDIQGFTIPVLVHGIYAMRMFTKLFGVDLDILVPQIAEIIPGLKTPVLGATHPFHFYAAAQADTSHGRHPWQTIGSGKFGPNCQLASLLMLQDLIAARWQTRMAENPSKDPGVALAECTQFWLDPQNKLRICMLVQHQGSMKFEGSDGDYKFEKSLEDANDFCSKHRSDPCVGR